MNEIPGVGGDDQPPPPPPAAAPPAGWSSDGKLPDVQPRPDKRIGLSIVGGLLSIGLLCFGIFAAFWIAIDCGGDGGSPYVAVASTRGQLCDTSAHGYGVALVALGPFLIGMIGTILATVRRSWATLLTIGGIATVAAVGSYAAWFLTPGDCTAEQEQALENWECATY